MTGQQLRNSILQEAIHGRLVPNTLQPGEKSARELLTDILAQRQKAENDAKGRKAQKLTLSEIEEEPWELPEGWEWCRLGDIGEFVRGNGIKKDEVRASGCPCVRYGELYTKYRGQFKKTVSCIDEALFSKCHKIKYGDVIMALTGENEYDIALATVYLGDELVAMGGDMTRLRPFVDSQYLVYAINSPYSIECKSHLATGQIIVHISNDKLASLLIPLPPLSIQRAIVEKIESLLPLVEEYDVAQGELRTLNEALPDKLRKSVLQEAIHGRLVPNTLQPGEKSARELLGDILAQRQKAENDTKGRKAKKLTLSEIEEEPWELPEGWEWCKVKDVCELSDATKINGSFINMDAAFLRGKNNGIPIDNGRFVSKGSRMILVDGENSGEIFIAPCDGYLGSTFKQLLIFNEDCAVYLLQFLLFNKDLFRNNKKGAAIPHLNKDVFRELCFPLPPLSIQRAIVEKIEEIFKLLEGA